MREDLRGRGLGHELFAWAIEEARRRGCALVQLTSDKRRADAHRFYSRLGFVASHEGFKLHLSACRSPTTRPARSSPPSTRRPASARVA